MQLRVHMIMVFIVIIVSAGLTGGEAKENIAGIVISGWASGLAGMGH